MKKHHIFLNKTQTVVGQDLGTHQYLIRYSKTLQYTWKSAPIDNTDIPRCLIGVVCRFKFPMKIDLNAAQKMNCNEQSVLYIYFGVASNGPPFAVSVLQVLNEERRPAHQSH